MFSNIPTTKKTRWCIRITNQTQSVLLLIYRLDKYFGNRELEWLMFPTIPWCINLGNSIVIYDNLDRLLYCKWQQEADHAGQSGQSYDGCVLAMCLRVFCGLVSMMVFWYREPIPTYMEDPSKNNKVDNFLQNNTLLWYKLKSWCYVYKKRRNVPTEKKHFPFPHFLCFFLGTKTNSFKNVCLKILMEELCEGICRVYSVVELILLCFYF